MNSFCHGCENRDTAVCEQPAWGESAWCAASIAGSLLLDGVVHVGAIYTARAQLAGATPNSDRAFEKREARKQSISSCVRTHEQMRQEGLLSA